MLGYIDKNKRHKRKKKSFGGSLYIPKKRKRHRDNATDGKPREERPYG